MKKKSLKLNFIISSTSILTLMPIAVVGCLNKNNNSDQTMDSNLNNEIARINSLNLSLKNNLLTDEEINGFINAPLTFLSERVNGWLSNPHFSYEAKLVNDSTKKQLKLTITIISLNDTNNRGDSKEFIFNYQNNIDLQKEVDELNKSNLRLNKEEFFEYEINSITEFNLKSYLTGYEFKNNVFGYEVTKLKKMVDKFKFNLNVYLLTNNKKVITSKEFEVSFKIKSSNSENNLTINEEVDAINKSTIQLFNNRITGIQYVNIDESNITDFIIGHYFKKDVFGYEVINFNKTKTSIKFKFNVFIWSNKDVKKATNEISLYFSVEQDISSPSTTIEEEVNRINKDFQTSVVGGPLSFKEFSNLNIYNLWTRFSNTNFFDTTKFKYRVNFLTKSNVANEPYKMELKFSFRVLKDGETPDNNNNFTNERKFLFDLTPTVKDVYQIDKDYFTNTIDPVNDGSYELAKYGGGTGNQSISVSDKGPSKTDPSPGVPNQAKQIKGTVFSDAEVRQLKNTFSLGFVSYSGANTRGTGWILDYKLTDDGSYPTTWYFGTNAHVIEFLKVSNDFISPERYEDEYPGAGYYNTQRLHLRTIKNPEKGKEYPTLDGFDSDWLAVADIPAYNLKTVYIGTDFLKTSPSDFTTSIRWANNEEYADFAVMEVKFKDEEEAWRMTQNYVEETDRHFKYKKQSLLKSEIKEKFYSVIGFPDADKGAFSLSSDLYTSRAATDDNKPIDTNYDNLQNLATSPWYKMFKDQKYSIFDAAIGLSYFGMDHRLNYSLRKYYNSWGLVYPLDYANLGAGSSGSMMMDKEGYTVGVHFAADPTASMGFAQALYCEGFNYQGKFGSYNLEGYDLIEGGFPNQKSSYKGNLKRLYGNNFKTKLFPNGLN